MKECISCHLALTLESFYVHKGMKDGRLNLCKTCAKDRAKENHNKKSLNKDWLNKERTRGREKYHRLNYKEIYKPSYERKRQASLNYREKFPEKLRAKSLSNFKDKIKKGMNRHHWSYNEEHARDVIVLSIEDHNYIHRFINYDKESFMYKTLSGELLDSREKSISYYNSILKEKLNTIY
tara:strand:- start:34 stop:573 length:540 start_codon:yes stop_codon:yes gene_type:complete